MSFNRIDLQSLNKLGISLNFYSKYYLKKLPTEFDYNTYSIFESKEEMIWFFTSNKNCDFEDVIEFTNIFDLLNFISDHKFFNSKFVIKLIKNSKFINLN